jgi:hypothetical protein
MRSDHPESSDPEPTLAARLDRLFETFHSRSEPEQTAAAVASSVGCILGVPVAATAITRLRTGHGADPPDQRLLGGLARHFGVRADYLTGSGAEVTLLHNKLKLLADVRDAGMRRLALRGGAADPELLDTVLEILNSLDRH